MHAGEVQEFGDARPCLVVVGAVLERGSNHWYDAELGSASGTAGASVELGERGYAGSIAYVCEFTVRVRADRPNALVRRSGTALPC
jgi:hypothetical protein